LFDVVLNIPKEKKRMSIQNNLSINLELTQLGLEENMSAKIIYTISDFAGNTYLVYEETLDNVYDNLNLQRDFNTQDFPMGSYVIGVQVIYANGVAVASSQFVIEDKLIETTGLAIILIAFLVVVIFIILWIKKEGGIKYLFLKYILRKVD